MDGIVKEQIFSFILYFSASFGNGIAFRAGGGATWTFQLAARNNFDKWIEIDHRISVCMFGTAKIYGATMDTATSNLWEHVPQ